MMPDSTPARSPWLLNPAPKPGARLRLYCFPYAGAGASALHAWAKTLPREIEPLLVQLPGRESRLREAPFENMPALLDALAGALLPALRAPYALFGYSLGALVAFEFARRLQQQSAPAPLRLLAAARRAPHLPNPDPLISQLPAEDFAAAVQRRYNGIPQVIWENPELLGLFLPTLRADIVLGENYDCAPGAPLVCPISAYGGDADARVTSDQLLAWQAHTQAGFNVRLLPGDHFFVQRDPHALAQAVAQDLLA